MLVCVCVCVCVCDFVCCSLQGYVVFRGGCVVGDDDNGDISGPFPPFSKRRWGGIRGGRLALELSPEEREKALLLKPQKKQVMGSRFTATSPSGSAGISAGEGVLAELGRIRRYAAWRALWKLKRRFDRAMSVSSDARGKENLAPSLQGAGALLDVNHATAKRGERVFVKPGWEVIEDKRWPVGKDDSTGSVWQRWRLVAGGGRRGKKEEGDEARGRWRVDSLSTRVQEWSKIQVEPLPWPGANESFAHWIGYKSKDSLVLGGLRPGPGTNESLDLSPILEFCTLEFRFFIHNLASSTLHPPPSIIHSLPSTIRPET